MIFALYVLTLTWIGGRGGGGGGGGGGGDQIDPVVFPKMYFLERE